MGHADSWILLGPVSRQEGCVWLSGIGRARAEWPGHIPAAPPEALTDSSELNGYLPPPFLTPSPSASLLHPRARLLPTNWSYTLLWCSPKCALYASVCLESLPGEGELLEGQRCPCSAANILALLPPDFIQTTQTTLLLPQPTWRLVETTPTMPATAH